MRKGTVNIKGVTVNASHGAYGFEREEVHPFTADAVLYTEDIDCGDELARTCGYGKAADIMAEGPSAPGVDPLEWLLYTSVAPDEGCEG